MCLRHTPSSPEQMSRFVQVWKYPNNENNQSRNNFQWPLKGKVKCPDFEPTAECGHGLHGLLWGQGDSCLLNWDADAKWCVVEVDAQRK
jgi:hypothetical protein